MQLDRIFSQCEQIQAELLVTIDKFTEDDLSYNPFEISWPVGAIILHIAGAEEGWFRYVVKRELSDRPKDFRLANFSTKENITYFLIQVHQQTQEFLGSLDENDIVRKIETS